MGRWQDGRATLCINGGAAGTINESTAGAIDESTAGAIDESTAGAIDGSAAGTAAPPVAAIPLEIAASYRARTRGLLGRDGIDGAILLTPAGSIHTFRMRFPIDVAYLDRRLRVLSVRTMKPGRLGAPRLRARHVLEAEAGAMEKWGLRPGVRITVEG
ncbi:DUF192 domain-containing protein [Streptomyces sp. URMC 127]|uniref:DUF192 domain-containing protein n=1 Tax=Streptomyces sp. URMC 127 TaxID=3423402 RepID=UPI003F1CC5F1